MKFILILFIILGQSFYTSCTKIKIFDFIPSKEYSKVNYAGGNGTITKIRNRQNEKWIYRKHIQHIQIGDLTFRDNLDINLYKKPDRNTRIRKLNYGEYIVTKQVVEIIKDSMYTIWLNIETDNKTDGWIYWGEYDKEYASYMSPYFDNRWEITDYIENNGRIWTIRKMITDTNSFSQVLDIRDKPGLINTTIIGKIIPPLNEYGYNQMIYIDIIEATEEEDTIDGLTNKWLKINYKGIEGWIFGGYTGVERGGFKYYLPENMIFLRLGLFSL